MTQSPHATPGQAGSPLSLSISISGGKETNKDSLSSGEREEPSLKIGRLGVGVVWKRPQRRTGPKFPGKGAREVRARRADPVAPRRCLSRVVWECSPNRAVNSVKAKYGRGRWRTSTRVKMKRTLKRESRVLEIVGRKRMGAAMRRSDASGAIRSARSVGRGRRIKVGRGGCFVEPSHGIESSKWAIFGKQSWRCGMNRKRVHGAQLRANLEPTKGVGRLRQRGGGHGSRNPLRSV
ncbi:hypothetical protein Bca4012_102762 [Brassica carinata]